MNECARFEEAIFAHVAGEPVPDGVALARHAEQCAECRALLTLHGTLLDLRARAGEGEPGPARFAAMRTGVLRRARVGRSVGQSTGGRPVARAAWLTLRPATAAAAAVLLLVTGFAAARLRFFDGTRGRAGELLLHEIASDAATNRSLVDVEDSPFIYSDVTLRTLPGDRVSLDFDVTRHVSTVEAATSPLVQDVLAQALLNPSHAGSRLKAIELAAGTMSPKVRDALVFALHHDDNLAVRLKALTILREQPGADPVIETALLTTLCQDESVQMRLEALDFLATRRLDPDAIRRAIDVDETDNPAAAALMVRLSEYERSSRSQYPNPNEPRR